MHLHVNFQSIFLVQHRKKKKEWKEYVVYFLEKMVFLIDRTDLFCNLTDININLCTPSCFRACTNPLPSFIPVPLYFYFLKGKGK